MAFDTRSFVLDIACQQRRWELQAARRGPKGTVAARRLKVDKLTADINPEESKVRVEAEGSAGSAEHWRALRGATERQPSAE